MKLRTLFFSFFLIMILTSCTQKTEVLKDFKETQNSMSIQYTKKKDIIYDGAVKVMFFATYLNKIDKKYETNKLNSFVVGLHIVNQQNHDLIENRFNIFMNDKEAKNIIKIPNDSELVTNLTLKNSWASYYLIHFDNNEDENILTLKLTHPVYGQTQVKFDKEN